MVEPRLSSTPLPAESGQPQPRVDIIGIGVQKAATAWLYRCLIEHPEIREARAGDRLDKETNFFNHYWERGYRWYHDRFEFGPWKTAEFSTLYFHDRDVPERLAAYNPGARLLLSLRDPVERALSQHRHEIRQGRVPKELYSFPAALAGNPSYVAQGLYARNLERWLECFPTDQIHVIDYSDVGTEPERVIRDVYTFCEVDPGFEPSSLRTRINVSTRPRNQTVSRVLRRAAGLARRILGEPGARAVARTGLSAWIHRLNEQSIDSAVVPPLEPDEIRGLASLFAGENRRLEKILDQDFSHWTAP